MFEKWLLFVKGHQVIIIAVLAALLLWFGWSKWIGHRDRSDQTSAQTAHDQMIRDQGLVSVQQKQVQALENTVNQQTAEIQALTMEVRNAIAKRDSTTEAHIEREATDPLVSVASRWVTLIKGSSSDVRVGPDGNVAVTAQAARQTTEALEQGQAAEADYQDLAKLDLKKDQQIEGLNALIVSERDSAKSEILLAQDQAASCKADAKVALDASRKKSHKSFFKGLATGAVAVAAIALRFL